eukprot:scaffold2161_cov225-Prasinococcus_capsulatus_cf.AAC.1
MRTYTRPRERLSTQHFQPRTAGIPGAPPPGGRHAQGGRGKGVHEAKLLSASHDPLFLQSPVEPQGFIIAPLKGSVCAEHGTEQQHGASDQLFVEGLDNHWMVEHPTLRTKQRDSHLRTPS